MADYLSNKGKLLKYIGDDYILGEISREDAYYWRVHPVIRNESRKKEDRVIDYHRVVCFPKWSTEIVKEEGIT